MMQLLAREKFNSSAVLTEYKSATNRWTDTDRWTCRSIYSV